MEDGIGAEDRRMRRRHLRRIDATGPSIDTAGRSAARAKLGRIRYTQQWAVLASECSVIVRDIPAFPWNSERRNSDTARGMDLPLSA